MLVRQDRRAVPVRGFSLIEMLVVLSIIVVITFITITGQSTFNRSLLLTDTAYTIAFSVREVQTLGLSSRVFNSTQNAGYGLRFDIATPTSYVEFADTTTTGAGSSQGGLCPGHTATSGPDMRPGNCLYNAGSTPTELVRTYVLNRGFSISKFCGTAAGTYRCSPTDFATMDIVFMRPNTNSVIIGKTTSGTLISLTDATIYLNSPDNQAQRCITVSKVGQVAVTTSCP
jgi:prepilin-type N-terminal cleavage/methylation domain-containing protein